MIDYLNVGSVPIEEDCSQVGSQDYLSESHKECQAFLHQLKRQFGDPPFGARFIIETFPHDFGEYREVCIEFDNQIDEASEYAFKVEGETPTKWDKQAKEELAR